MMENKWLIYLLFLISAIQAQQPPMKCSYGGRGSLSSICWNATSTYFRKTSYRFDNLDETVLCFNCNLQIIEGGTFDLPGNQIKHLDLQNSQITILKPKAFIGLIFLTHLNLKNNHIGVVPPETFQGVTKIERLNLNGNSIESLVSNGFKELNVLMILDLSNNKIKKIEYSAFAGLSRLAWLYMPNNELTEIKRKFDDLTEVVIINLDNNKISRIDPGDINLYELYELQLANNNLKILSKDGFLELVKLHNLNLSSNPIETIELGAFRGLDSMEELDLSNCLVSAIPKGLLKSLHQLRTLDLGFNRLTAFETGAFSGLPLLRKLNMSHNKIEKYKKTGVLKLQNLHILDLSFNNLNDLDYKSLVQHLPALSRLELESNPWPCYLKKEMEELFAHDNFAFDLGPVFEGTCNGSKPIEPVDPNPSDSATTTMSTPVYLGSRDAHEYILYVFMILLAFMMVFLFYLQYRDRQEIGIYSGRSDISEARLLSNRSDAF